MDPAIRNLSVYTAIRDQDLNAADQIAAALQSMPTPEVSRIATLLSHVVSMNNLDTDIERRKAYPHFITHLLEYVYVGLKDIQSRGRSGLLSRQGANDPWLERFNEYIQNQYWTYQLIITRQNGSLPAWEGIRIVRERL